MPRRRTQKAVNTYWRTSIATNVAWGAPAYVQVELGINDAIWQPSANLAGYKKRIERFISWLPPGVPVLWDNIPAMSPAFDPTLDQNYQIVNRALGRAAAETPNLYIVDLRTPFAGHWPDWYQSDQLHYNDTGQYEFALVNCQELNTVSAALDPQPIGVDAPCDPNYGSTTTVASVRDTR